jgi:hypothetical protein
MNFNSLHGYFSRQFRGSFSSQFRVIIKAKAVGGGRRGIQTTELFLQAVQNEKPLLFDSNACFLQRELLLDVLELAVAVGFDGFQFFVQTTGS